MRMQGITFVPSTLTVKVEDTVTWTNDDSMNHTVTSGSPGNKGTPLNSGNIANSGIFQFTFDTPGTYVYFCEIHPGQMRDAKIIVQE